MLHCPGSLDQLLSLFRGCFTQPSFQTFRALAVGQISRVGAHTVCGMLVGARLSAAWGHCRAHRFFSRRRWSPDEVGLALTEWIVARLVDAGAPIVVAIDDTLTKRRGRKVFGVHWHHDASANAKPGATARGNCWVVAGIVVRLPFLGRAICMPVGCRLWQPRRKQIAKGKADPERPSKPALAREIVDLLAERLPGRAISVVGDAAYASRAWRDLPERVTVTFRLRRNAALHAPAPPPTGRRGRPAVKGERLPGLEEIARDQGTSWQQVEASPYGRAQQLRLHDRRCVWYRALLGQPVRLVMVGEGECGYGLALITTDLDSEAAQIVERYADRWSIEVAFEEGKGVFGVGEARNRTERAVERTVPFQLLCQSMVVCWYAAFGHDPAVVAEHRARAPWYRTKADPSFADMLAKLRRLIIAAQYRPEGGSTPSAAEISEVQAAWAAAGC